MGKIDIVLGNDNEALYVDGRLKTQARRLTIMDLAMDGGVPMDLWEGYLHYSEGMIFPPTLDQCINGMDRLGVEGE